MKRRHLLGAVATLGVGVAAGCLSVPAQPSPRTSTAPPTTSPPSLRIEVMDGECGTEDTATITLDGGAVTISGMIAAPTPCYDAKLADVRRENGTLRLRVDAYDPPPGTPCMECVGLIPYEITGSVGSPMPDELVVEHSHWDTVEQVASWPSDEA